MEVAVYLLAAYGLVFGVQHKLPTIRHWRLGDLLECPYCLGLWAGWALWGVSHWAGAPLLGGTPPEGAVWAFASAATCQLVEEQVVRWKGEP